MEAFLIYLLKSSGIIALFLLFYILFLKRETFFHTNRIYLLTGLGLAIIVPFLVFTKIIWLQPMPMYQIQILDKSSITRAMENSIDWTSLIFYGYFAGVSLFVLRLFVQLLSLNKLLRSGKKIREGLFIRIETDQKSSPFSFFTYLVYNPDLHTPSELNTILTHEGIHAEGRHSVDMLAMQLFAIFQWCNPFVWWYRACLNDNLEYVADIETIADNTDKMEYQYLLLQTGMGEKHYPMATPFFNNSIKKRIIMLNKNRSARRNTYKYAIMLPLLAGFIFTFNVKTEAQIIPSTNTQSSKIGKMESHVYSVRTTMTDDELKELQKKIRESGGKLIVKSVIRNQTGKMVSFQISYRSEGGYVSGKYDDTDDINAVYFGENNKGGVFITTDKTHLESLKKGNMPKPTDKENEYNPVTYNKEHSGDFPIIQQNGSYDIHVKSDELIYPGSDGHFTVYLGGQDALYMVDGKEVSKTEFEKIDPNWIQSVYVWKGQQAIDRFGDKGKNGVQDIRLKKDYLSIPKTEYTDDPKVRPSAIIVHDPIDGSPLVTGKASGIKVSPQDKGQLVILDGKEVPFSKIDTINPENIESINVWKGQQAIKKYGDKGKNGVIEIATKKE